MTALDAYHLDTGQYPSTDQGPGSLALPTRRRAELARTGATFTSTGSPGAHNDKPDLASYGADVASGGEGLNSDIMSWR